MSTFMLCHGDCLKVMETMPAHSVDLILTDLPYGCTRNQWDKKLPLSTLWRLYKRILRRGGVIVLFGKQRFGYELVASNFKNFRYKLVWQKTFGTDFMNAHRKPLSMHEDILVFCEKQTLYNPQMRTGFSPYQTRRSKKPPKNYGHLSEVNRLCSNTDGTRYPVDVVTFPIARNGIHPTAKPVELLELLIKTYTNEGMLVLDSCMGCGSTGIACKRTNRHFIGIELNNEYYTAAVSLMRQEAERGNNGDV